jgi:hypothetical protein
MLQAQARVFYLFELNQKTNLGILNHIVEKNGILNHWKKYTNSNMQ